MYWYFQLKQVRYLDDEQMDIQIISKPLGVMMEYFKWNEHKKNYHQYVILAIYHHEQHEIILVKWVRVSEVYQIEQYLMQQESHHHRNGYIVKCLEYVPSIAIQTIYTIMEIIYVKQIHKFMYVH
ncbi:MAG: hypothetical protein LBU14_04265 [Candidatus Peribacteria bacterium]|jgi:hypothetical protein|nr:hypothetical protein [Candidatus Peribacteria bacterium]